LGALFRFDPDRCSCGLHAPYGVTLCAYMAALTWWLDGGVTLSPQQMDRMFRRLAAQGAFAQDF
jgi:hypothetical protein